MKEIADKGYDLLSIGETKNGSEVKCLEKCFEIFGHSKFMLKKHQKLDCW